MKRVLSSFLLLFVLCHHCAWAQTGRLADSLVLCTDMLPVRPLNLPPDTVSVRILGDVMLHTAQIESAAALWSGKDDVSEHCRFDFSDFFAGIEEDMRSADICIANMEFSLGGAPFTGYPAFSAPDSYAAYVADCGVDIFLAANNHILDRRESGLTRTLGVYSEMEKSRNVKYTGCGSDSQDYAVRNPLIVHSKGMTLAIVNFTYGTNTPSLRAYPRVCREDDLDDICASIRALRKRVDIVIALPHWGQEYVHKHNRQQEYVARRLAQSGADVIVGAHPHVVQDFATILTENSREVPVYYSLGNAVSNMSAPGTRTELMVTLSIVRDDSGEVRLDSHSCRWLWCSRPGEISSGYMVVGEDAPARLWNRGREVMTNEISNVKMNIR